MAVFLNIGIKDIAYDWPLSTRGWLWGDCRVAILMVAILYVIYYIDVDLYIQSGMGVMHENSRFHFLDF